MKTSAKDILWWLALLGLFNILVVKGVDVWKHCLP